MKIPFPINYRKRDNTLCGHFAPGNGGRCDDCWWAFILSDDEPEQSAPEPAKAKRREAVSPCQATLF